VAAGAVVGAPEFLKNPDLRATGFLQTPEHPEIGPVTHMGPPFRIFSVPRVMRAAPRLGQDTESVITKTLGMSDAEFLELYSAGVLA
jgi:crotonobetainyl-CoA:carnitine CoA-transferase CaiB-like acyl-CoA transferase